ncbi:hypothetical protein SAMN05216490_0148 [Mucilaginibacter mallensis]|uniref:Uncharacterized protein n=1 Tax=Mucilaginibacter mallensis TaxID=652787 RepID=A0A1H1MRZ1_MUCMA|nr:hypothetical protein [Mucilaginibacter mallensis]SDR89524.1 hypothetical protein SAMN05216490_0148 [Mucilaginibacter mallensis]
MKQKITLEEFLNEQTTGNFLCTIELVPGDDTKVKLTPWIDESGGCSCDSSLIVNKNLIESIIPTELRHFCCGKRHKVVEVIFVNDASVKITDLIENAISKAKNPHAHDEPLRGGANTGHPSRPLGCPQGFQPCGNGCYNPSNQCCCEDSFGNVSVKDNSNGYSCYNICGGYAASAPKIQPRDCQCTYGGSTYYQGDQICIGGYQNKCGCNGWVNLGFNC